MQNTIFYNNIHLLRGIAILLIVCNHAARSNFSWIQVDKGLLASFLDIFFFKNCTIIFVFISGFLFQLLIKKYSYKSYILKKVKYVVLPYLIMSLPMFLVIPLIIGTKSLDSWHFVHFKQPLQKIVLGFLTGSTCLSYWYIPCICIVYCCFPIFVLMNKFPKLYFLLIPSLYIATIIGRPITDNNPLHSFGYFLPSYLIGIIFARYSHTIKYRNGKIIGIISLIISIFLVLPQVLFSTEYGSNYIVETITNTQIFDANLFQKIFLAFFLFYNLPTKINGVNFLLAKLADASFAIFFIFDYIHIGTCYLLKISKIDLLIIPSIGICLIYFLFIIVFSYSIAVCIKKISGKHSRFVIGW